MQLHPVSHLDHDLTARQLGFILLHFADRDAFFLETLELPAELGTLPCALWGPAMGDPPVPDDEVTMIKRGDRAWPSRISIEAKHARRQTRQLTVIGGPFETLSCILYTAYGGPAAPQEPGEIRQKIAAIEAKRLDLARCLQREPGFVIDRQEADRLEAALVDLRRKREESDAFWRDHALAK